MKENKQTKCGRAKEEEEENHAWRSSQLRQLASIQVDTVEGFFAVQVIWPFISSGHRLRDNLFIFFSQSFVSFVWCLASGTFCFFFSLFSQENTCRSPFVLRRRKRGKSELWHTHTWLWMYLSVCRIVCVYVRRVCVCVCRSVRACDCRMYCISLFLVFSLFPVECWMSLTRVAQSTFQRRFAHHHLASFAYCFPFSVTDRFLPRDVTAIFWSAADDHLWKSPISFSISFGFALTHSYTHTHILCIVFFACQLTVHPSMPSAHYGTK